MIGQIYLGTIAASAGMAAAGEIIANYKLKKDGYVPKKIKTKEAKIFGTTVIAIALAVPGINLLYGGYTLLYDTKCYGHMKNNMLENGFLMKSDVLCRQAKVKQIAYEHNKSIINALS